MILRLANVLAFVALCATAAYLYVYKIETRNLQSKAVELEQRISQEREAIAVLETEWSHLTHPKRLERLSKEYLGLEAAKPSQIEALDESEMGASQK